jgi:WD40 repeat protein
MLAALDSFRLTFKCLNEWFNAPPASGKSILSACVISHLHGLGRMHQYFFFKFSNQSQRSLSAMLRSIACQAARDIPDFRRSLIELSTEGLRLEKADSTVIWHRIFESILFELDFEHPLFWIIDGLDESDSPKALLELLRTLPKSRTNIRVLIVSRKTEPLSIGVERLSGYIPVELIDNDACDHHSLDIRKFVEEEIKHMRGSDELKQRLTQSIMDRSGGNFLWVRLVLEEILKCHTENSIQETLDQIPEGMNSLYQHMELGILNNQRKSDRILAKSLFQWTICAQRPLTLKELSQALRPENPEFLDLRRTIQDVCGQFILVGQNGQVGMVHQTARDYLTTTFNSEISIDLRQAHEHLFKKTVTTLLDPRLRLRLTQNQHALQSTNAFVFYASISWAYHLRHSRTTSDEAFDLLVKLLKSPFVLTWIHSLALAGRLEILVKAAKALNNFAATTRKINVAKNPLLHRLSDLELLNLWAIDLVKVVGKFSRHLVLDPSAIYRLIPPFCPENSILHQQFHQPELAEVSVSGISNYHWNDNLARITVPGGDQAWNIACAGPYIAVLGAFGTIFLWNSYNFTEICALRHNEPVTAMGFNKNGSKLVTYGLQSTKLWSIPSGQVLASTPNPAQTKAMAIVFAENDTKALIGSDDKVVRYIRIDDFGAGWQVLNAALLREVPRIEGTVVNSPMCIAFNGDATQVGVSYRGFPLSVWEINEARCIGRCRRAKEPRSDLSRPSTGWFAVDRFTWNPVTGHIIGIYKDGCIFKWHPVTNENQEVQSTADEVAASPDGKLFVTSDSNGTIRVWNFAHFSIIYQLSSADLVTGLAFSPDCRRFYDLRGSCLNAWESNSLIRFSETEESFSDTGSDHQASTSVSQASEAYLVQYEAVTALAIPQNTSLYCVGNEEGVVNLFNAATGESIELTKFWNFLSVSLLAWSQDATHIAATDLGGEIVVKRLTLPDDVSLKSGFEIKSMPSPKLDLEGRGIHQLLFSYDSKSLLVICEDQGQIWSIDEGTLRGSVALTNGTSRKWLNHPTQTHLFLGFGTSDVEMFQWHDFAEQNCLYFHEDQSRVNGQTTFDGQDDKTMELRKLSFNDHDGLEFISTVNKAILTQDEKHLLLQIKHTSAKGRITKSVIIFDSSAFDVSGEQKFIAPSTYFSLPVDIMGKIEVPLDILTGFRFIFLDQDLWICTLNLRSMFDEEPLKRHYFIPRDWASTDSLEQCCVMKDGTFLSPREDKVAVIRNSLEVAGF